MRIIDFEKKGNLVRFYLGERTEEWGWTRPDYKENCNGELRTPIWLAPEDVFYGDDWDDRPYECNAGKVYDEFIRGYIDIAFDFDSLVLEPADCYSNNNSEYCKDDMVERTVPCIIIVPKGLTEKNCSKDFDYWVGCDKIKKFYFKDDIDRFKDDLTIIKYFEEENVSNDSESN